MTRTQLKSIIKTLLKEINEPAQSVDSVDTVSPNTDVPDTTINPKIATLNKKKNDDILLKQKLEASMVPKQKKIDQLTKDLIPLKKKVNDVNSDIQKVNQELEREKLDECSTIVLSETLTYDQLVKATKRDWSSRFDTVKGVSSEAPELVILKDGNVHLTFDYISRPSTEGIKHKGQIMFVPDERQLKDKLKGWWDGIKNKFRQFIGKPVPPQVMNGSDLRNMKCKVSCDCKDFKFRFEVADYRQSASDLKFSNGRFPTKTNPKNLPGICKHLLAVLEHLTDNSDVKIKRP